MEVICITDDVFYALLDRVIESVRKNNTEQSKWVNTEQAMQRLNIKSKTTLQKLRDEGRIRFSQLQKKRIVYDADSINEYLEKYAGNTF